MYPRWGVAVNQPDSYAIMYEVSTRAPGYGGGGSNEWRRFLSGSGILTVAARDDGGGAGLVLKGRGGWSEAWTSTLHLSPLVVVLLLQHCTRRSSTSMSSSLIDKMRKLPHSIRAMGLCFKRCRDLVVAHGRWWPMSVAH